MTDDAYTRFIEAEERLRRMEREAGIAIIDTLRARPGMRHIATDAGNGWMKTMCGRRVINYYWAGLTGRYYHDGTVYVNLCPICFPKQEP